MSSSYVFRYNNKNIGRIICKKISFLVLGVIYILMHIIYNTIGVYDCTVFILESIQSLFGFSLIVDLSISFFFIFTL